MKTRQFSSSCYVILLAVFICVQVGASAQRNDYDKSIETARMFYQPEKQVGREEAINSFREALTTHPDNPRNIETKIELGLLELQEEPSSPKGAKEEAERILATNSHEDAYIFGNANSFWCSSLFCPLIAYKLSLWKDSAPAKRRQWLEQCLDMVDATHERRLNDWLNEPDPAINGAPAKKQYGVLGTWEERQRKAASGLLWDIPESAVAQIIAGESTGDFVNQQPEAYLICLAVSQYVLSYPEGEDFVAGLTQLKTRYPEKSPVAIAISYAIAGASGK